MKSDSSPLDLASTDFCTLDYPCAYLPGRQTRMLYRYIRHATPAFVSAVVERGWRRFGNYFFHPICAGCNECRNLRIDTEAFTPTRSQRRVERKNAETRTLIQAPSLTPAHVELYNRYHSWKAAKDGWKHHDITEREYYENFVEGAHRFGYEVLYFRDDRLVGVDLIDIVRDGISAIYFFHDPDYAPYSLGTYSLLQQIALARRLGLRYIYLGYWVDGCKAFAYKTRFQPEEILDGFPPLDQSPRWKPFVAPESSEKGNA
ncbi:arginyltransferase [Nitratifractor sp.]